MNLIDPVQRTLYNSSLWTRIISHGTKANVFQSFFLSDAIFGGR